MATEKRVIVLDVNVQATEAQKSLEQLNGELAAQRQALTELNRTFKRGEVSQEEYGKQATALRKSIKELSTEQRGLERDLFNSTKLTDDLKGSNEQLKAQIALLTRQYNRLTKEERNNSKEGKQLTKDIESLTKELKKNEKAIGDNRRNVGNYASALDGLNLSIVDNIASIAGPGGLVAAFGIGLDFIKQGIQAVGEITREFTRFRGETQRVTGETEESLDSLTTSIQATAQTFDKEFNESLIATNAVAKQFNESQQEVSESIQKGFLAGADASGEFLDLLKEYPAQLRTVGLNASESIAIISQQVRQGIFSDQGIAAIEEAGLRLRELPKATEEALEGIGLSADEIQASLEDGSRSIFDVIQLVSEQLSKLPENSQEVGTAIADIFGGAGEKAGLQYLLTLQDIELELDNLIDQTNTLTQIQQDQLKVNEELAAAQNELSKQFEGSSEELGLLIKQGQIFLIETLLAIIEDLKPLIEAFKTVINLFGQLNDFITRGITLWNDFRESIGLARRDLDEAETAGSKFVGFLKAITGFGIPDLIDDIGGTIRNLTEDIVDLFNKGLELSNRFLGTDFEINVRTEEAAEGVDNLAFSVENLEAAVSGLDLPAPVPPDFSRFKKEADDLREEEEEKSKQSAKTRADNALKERVAGIELQLLAVEEGSKRELELQKELIDAKTELAVSGLENQLNQQKLIQERALQEQKALEARFQNERLKEATKELKSREDNIKKIVAKEIQANIDILIDKKGLSEETRTLSEEDLEIQQRLIKMRADAERAAAILSGELDDLSTQDQIDNINKILETATLSAEQRADLIRKLGELQAQQNQEDIASTQAAFDIINQILTGTSDIFVLQKERELKAAEGNEAEQENIRRRFAEKEKQLAIFQAILGAGLATIRVLQNLTLIPEPVGTIQKLGSVATIGGIALGAVAQIRAASFAEGGFTGSDGVSDPDIRGRKIVGYVHDNEYVMPTEVLRTNAGKNLAIQAESIRKSMPGFQDGGFTTPNFGGVSTFENRSVIDQNVSISTDISRIISELPPQVLDIREFYKVDNRVQVKENTGL